MFGIGTPELLVILAVALIVIGPKKLPDLAKSLGRAMGEFKRATNDLKQSIEQETGLDDVRDHFKEVKRDVLSSVNPLSYDNPKSKVLLDTSESADGTATSSPADDAQSRDSIEPSGPEIAPDGSHPEPDSDDPDDQGKNTV